MPWFPDFANAVELARRQSRAAGLTDPVMAYFVAINRGDEGELECWPGEWSCTIPVWRNPWHRILRFVRRNQSWLAERHARIETVAATVVGSRAVVELLAHLDGDVATWAWPVAVVAESPDDQSVVFRTYCSQWPVDGQRHLRPPILGTGDAHPGDVVGRYQVAVDQGDAEAIVGTFTPDGYLREPVGPHNTHRGHLSSALSSSSALVPAAAWASTLRRDRRRGALRRGI